MMLHQLGIQQAERETLQRLTFLFWPTLLCGPVHYFTFYIEPRQTLQVEVVTKTPDVVAAFSVKHGTTV